jgi:dUTPase
MNEQHRGRRHHHHRHQGNRRTPYAIKLRTHDDDNTWLPQQYNLINAYTVKIREMDHGNDSGLHSLELEPGEIVTVKLGFFLQLLPGWEAQIRSMPEAVSDGLIVLGGPHTLGHNVYNTSEEICIDIMNSSKETASIHAEEDIAILVISKVPHITLAHVKSDNMHPSFKDTAGMP